MNKKLLIALLVAALLLAIPLVASAQSPYPPPETEPPINLIAAPNKSVSAGDVIVPIQLIGNDINAVAFELMYEPGLTYVSTEFTLTSPFVGACDDTGKSIQCVAYGLGMDGNHALALPESSIIFYIIFTANASSSLVFDSYSFGDVYGQSVIGNARDGYIKVTMIDWNLLYRFIAFLPSIINR